MLDGGRGQDGEIWKFIGEFNVLYQKKWKVANKSSLL